MQEPLTRFTFRALLPGTLAVISEAHYSLPPAVKVHVFLLSVSWFLPPQRHIRLVM